MDSSWIECDVLLEKLDLYLDGELSVEERRVVEVHMSECEGCLDREEFVRSLRALIRRKCAAPEMPPGMAERIRDALRGPAES